MADDIDALDLSTLRLDARVDDVLERVSFQPGIMLGSEALTAEQDFHLRRLTRHQRWLVGTGTVFGLYVTVTPSTAPDGSVDIGLQVNPGYAIDGYGREIVVTEPYTVSLTQWLSTQNAAATLDPDFAQSYDATNGMLYLRVTVRARPCPHALQPVVSELFDSGLDPVVPARIAESFLLEILPDIARRDDAPAQPLDAWLPAGKTPAAGDVPPTLSAANPRESATMGAVTDPALAGALRLQAWLLQCSLPAFDDSPGTDSARIEAARSLLASVHVALPTLTTPPTAAGTVPNNLVRPFVRPNVLLAPLPLP